MRAPHAASRLLLAACVLAAAAPSPPPPPGTPAALLVLRAACAAPHPAAFFDRQLYAKFMFINMTKLLSYEETCGRGWRVAVARAGLAALHEGRTLAVAGALDVAHCAALGATARLVGRRVRGGQCARRTLRDAAVSRLAAALRWRRALLLPLGRCAGAVQWITSSLASEGLAVAWATSEEPTFRPHVVVVFVCGDPSSLSETVLTAPWASGETWASGVTRASGGAALLLVHVPQHELQLDDDEHDDDHKIEKSANPSNINFHVNSLPYVKMRENLLLTPNVSSLKPSKLSFYYLKQYVENYSSTSTFKSVVTMVPQTYSFNESESIVFNRARTFKNTSRRSVKNTDRRDEDSKEVNADDITTEKYFLKAKDSKINSHANVRNKDNSNTDEFKGDGVREVYFSSIIANLDQETQSRLLLLTTERLQDITALNKTEKVMKAIFEALSSNSNEEKTTFYLYERAANNWQRVAELHARASLLSGNWAAVTELVNASVLEGWAARGETTKIGVTFSLLAAPLATLALLLLAIASARWLTVRQRRRRRGSAVLTPEHFEFPADEGSRRVGEGMETMLSCWLQQLHEFGGPELERPDLLKQPSQPSSTCSVNRLAPDRRTRYKGDAVQMKYLMTMSDLELKRKASDILLVMQNLHHENLNPFIGCLCVLRPALVWAHGGRGSLEDVLVADDIRLDWTFRLSLLTDLVRGARHLHGSALRVHGRLTSRNCVVDSRWVLRITDYGLPSFYRAQGLPEPPRAARDLLWTAPELLREARGAGRGTQAGDVFSFSIIMQEVIVRGEPYCMLSLTPDEIIEKLCRPPPLIRPSVSMGAAPPEAVSVMRQCWTEAPELRPHFDELYEIFRHLHRGRKINIVDSMFEMLEKYSNNLEELIKERTEQLDMEKKKTEQLLNRMLPRSVAERLLLGSTVEPEEFEQVSIYFSDIVGFTELAARSSPVQVVDLLNDLYTTFDAAIEQHRVYKVETIGDAYMVVGGLPVRCTDHAERVATMALHLLHLAGRFRIRHLPSRPLHLRIGLHSGPCCAGVVGRTMPRYCLFGDTVNTASRMESTGAAWRVQVSAATADRLKAAGGYRLRSRGLTMIKGKGAMHTYWLLGKEGFDKPLPTPPKLEEEDVLLEAEQEIEAGDEPPEPDLAQETELGEGEVGVHGGGKWQRSGTLSADSSPPPRAPSDLSAPYSRYRCSSAAGSGGGGVRALRRQWSLERGEALAVACGAAAASSPAVTPTTPSLASAPLALQAAPARAPPRYRTRPDAPDSTDRVS